MKPQFTGLTDIGNVRAVNQDAFHLDSEGRFFIVADGMGGHAGGQEASQIAAQVIQEYLNSYWETSEPSPALLKGAFQAANKAILQDQKNHPERSDMGTTAVVVLFRDENQPWYANVGDSRLYRLRGESLQQLSEDQTWVAQAVKREVLTPEEARTHPWRHVLSQCLGREDLTMIEIEGLDIQPGDRLLLCSDGLTEELPDDLIGQVLAGSVDYEAIASHLVREAKAREGKDNVTVVLVGFDPLDSLHPVDQLDLIDPENGPA
ncbi:MAG: serine/threonine-protein phosphatase [Oscillatoriales cyanobacterium RM1_1_9]|nr:serine/threonine-protein phosphatase [Oscillatoriales cyanobacterium SM2_3_0]NJO46931.1 serine/threonine-protein phosphatase [Oscillatoriales cyanobacterium RM2_1_1]NJO70963.1 serine/threonine-protein phosphatase [Oscillatoriales cyanobacterium RM1_1_9]